MLTHVKQSAASVARKAGLFTGGLLFIAVGTGFLTVALWITLALAHGAMIASLVIGLAYFGLGLVMLGLASNQASSPAKQSQTNSATIQPDASPPTDVPPLIQAFFHGVQAGAKAGKRSD